MYSRPAGTTVIAGATAEEVAAAKETADGTSSAPTFSTPDELLAASTLVLTEEEKAQLDGVHGEANKVAMRTIARAAGTSTARNYRRTATLIGYGGGVGRFSHVQAHTHARARTRTITLNTNHAHARALCL